MAFERYQIRIDNGLIHDVRVADEYFDLIILDNALEHTFDPLSTLIKAFRLLRKGGGLFIFVPNADGLSTRFLNVNAHWGHWFSFSPKVLYGIVRHIGYRVPRLSAIQSPVNPKLLEQGIDVEPYRSRLAISLKDENGIVESMSSMNFRADYFQLMAVKPAEGPIVSEQEAELLNIAQCSIRQREKVDIITRPMAH